MPRSSRIWIALAVLACAATAAADPRYGSLKLTSQPDSAQVILDGKDLGRTPLTSQAIVPGTYLLVVIKDGYRRWTKAVTFEGGTRVVGKAMLQAMTPAEADSMRRVDSIRADAYQGFIGGLYRNVLNPGHIGDESFVQTALCRLPELRKRVSPVYIPADAPVPARCNAIIAMLVAENGAVIWAFTAKGTGSLVVDDAVWDAARHSIFAPALDLDSLPARTWVIGFFSTVHQRDSLQLVELAVVDTTGQATASDSGAYADTAAIHRQVGKPPTKLYIRPEKEAKPIKRVDPVYPEELRPFQIEGRVTVWMEIDSEGRVANATVVKGAYNELLNNAAVDAAKQWVFKPALARGKKPVKSWTTHEFTFKLK